MKSEEKEESTLSNEEVLRKELHLQLSKMVDAEQRKTRKFDLLHPGGGRKDLGL
jgi:hypothetical protein